MKQVELFEFEDFQNDIEPVFGSLEGFWQYFKEMNFDSIKTKLAEMQTIHKRIQSSPNKAATLYIELQKMHISHNTDILCFLYFLGSLNFDENQQPSKIKTSMNRIDDIFFDIADFENISQKYLKEGKKINPFEFCKANKIAMQKQYVVRIKVKQNDTSISLCVNLELEYMGISCDHAVFHLKIANFFGHNEFCVQIDNTSEASAPLFGDIVVLSSTKLRNAPEWFVPFGFFPVQKEKIQIDDDFMVNFETLDNCDLKLAYEITNEKAYLKMMKGRTLKDIAKITSIPYQTLLTWSSRNSRDNWRKKLMKMLEFADKAMIENYFK